MKRFLMILTLIAAAHGFAAAPVSREDAIKADLAENRALIAKYGSIEALAEAIKPGIEANNRSAEQKEPGKWVGDSYYSPGIVTIEEDDFAEFKDAAIRLDRFCKSRNIDLIIVRVPARQELALARFAGMPVEPDVSNPWYRQLEKELLEADVEYIDGLKPVGRSKGDYPLYYWYNVPGEGHPAEGALQAVAAEVASRLARYNLPKTGDYHFAQIEDTFARGDAGHPYPAGNPRYEAGKLAKYSVLLDQDGKAPQIGEENRSPVLFISDSYGAYTGGREKGGSMPHYVMAHTSHQPDWMYRSASSEGAATFLARKGADFVKGRRVIVLNAHPNSLKCSSRLPDEDLLYIAPERIHPLLKFDARNWNELNLTTPAGGDRILPDGGLRLATVNPALPKMPRNALNAKMTVKLPAEAVAKYHAVLVECLLRKHSYAKWTVTSGKNYQRDFMSTSEKVPAIAIPIRLDGDTVTIELPSVQNEMIIDAITVSGIDL